MLQSNFETRTLKNIFYYLQGLWYTFRKVLRDQTIQCFMHFRKNCIASVTSTILNIGSKINYRK